MSLPASHVLPASAFRHIGVMMLFLGIIAAICIAGFLGVRVTTQGWSLEIIDTLHIEIPPYDPQSETVLSEDRLQGDMRAVNDFLADDPIVMSLKQDRPAPLTIEGTTLDIPSPVFITVGLNPDRAKNAENRLRDNIKNIIPAAIIRTESDWRNDIDKTAMIFQLLFGGLALSVFAVAGFVITAVIHTQIKANKTVIGLIHLMGAYPETITSIFRTAVIKPVLWGCFFGVGISCAIVFPLLKHMGWQDMIIPFLISCGGIVALFLFLAVTVTSVTVRHDLRRLP